MNHDLLFPELRSLSFTEKNLSDLFNTCLNKYYGVHYNFGNPLSKTMIDYVIYQKLIITNKYTCSFCDRFHNIKFLTLNLDKMHLIYDKYNPYKVYNILDELYYGDQLLYSGCAYNNWSLKQSPDDILTDLIICVSKIYIKHKYNLNISSNIKLAFKIDNIELFSKKCHKFYNHIIKYIDLNVSKKYYVKNINLCIGNNHNITIKNDEKNDDIKCLQNEIESIKLQYNNKVDIIENENKLLKEERDKYFNELKNIGQYYQNKIKLLEMKSESKDD